MDLVPRRDLLEQFAGYFPAQRLEPAREVA